MMATWSVPLTLACLGSVHGVPSNPPVAQDIEGSSWYARVSADIRRGEYAYVPSREESLAWSAPNRSQGFKSRVSKQGLEIFPREPSGDDVRGSWTFSMRTSNFGRLGDVEDLETPSISTQSARIELDHGLLREWFENRADGLEQGFSVTARPKGREALWIGLEIRGDLSLRIDDGARAGALVDAGGDVRLRYRDLIVFDATGRALDARFSASPSGVGIRIDDSDAVYPLTVDPVLTGPAWTVESNQAAAAFGYSVATAGDVNGDGYSDVLVGAYKYDNPQQDEGRAYLFLGSAGGLAASPAWTAEGDQAQALFGFSVATAGDVNGDGFSDVIVGAMFYTNPDGKLGRVFVYLGSASGLAAAPAWSVQNHSAWGNSKFGYSVATAGDVNGDGLSDVIVGAPWHSETFTLEGGAFLYLGSPSGLQASPSWTAEGGQPGPDAPEFGTSVASAGDVNGDGYGDVIVGAPRYNTTVALWDEGRAYVYLGSASGLAASAAWTADGGQADAHFGNSVSGAGDVDGDGFNDVIVGTTSWDNPEPGEGRASLYAGSVTGLGASAEWTVESNQFGWLLGSCVATAGDVNGDGYSDVIVTADGYDNAESNEGYAGLYLGSANGLATTASWTAEGNQSEARFGASAGTAGDVNGDGYSDLIVGAPDHDSPESNEGRAYVYLGSAEGLAATDGWTAESHQANASFGVSVASAGDTNGDGYGDVIVGAHAYDDPELNEGRATLYLGSAAGLSPTDAWSAESDQAGAIFGASVASAGDVNGDGYSDVIVGAGKYSNPEVEEGRAYLYLGSGSGLAASALWTAEGDQAGAFFGASVASAGDVNGDGYNDVIVGASGYGNPESAEGRALVYLGTAGGLDASPAWTAEVHQAGAAFGRSVATAGDVNGDGYSDVIVGAPAYDDPESNEGRAFVYLGSAVGLSGSAAWTAESNQAGAEFGYSVATAGDVNGDGYSDVIIGSYRYDNPESSEGRAYVYLGSSGGLAASPAWTAESNQANADFGLAVASAGDVNGDGYSDVIVGSYRFDNGELHEGRAFVYLGSASGLAASAAWTAESQQADAWFGFAVSTAGDVDGDGFSDVIVGAPAYDNPESSEGRAFVYLGNAGRGGWTLAPQQRQANDAAPIELLGRSSSMESFRIRSSLAHDLTGFRWGTGRAPTVRLQWEVAPLHVALDGTSVESGTEQEVAGLPLVFNELVGFSGPPGGGAHGIVAGPYHWRVRLRTNNPIFPVTPWVSIQGNNETESKLRVGQVHDLDHWQ